MAKVYRIQNKDGEGPYWNSDWDVPSNHYDETHPNGYIDKGIYRHSRGNERFGFISLEQLYNWFSESDLQELTELGFQCVVLEAKITKRGQYQILFNYKSAKYCGEIELCHSFT